MPGEAPLSALEPEAAAFPDFCAPDAADWLETTVRRARALAWAPELELLDRALPAAEAEAGPLGPLGSERFRRLILALLAADWASYDGTERAELERLALSAARFPRGFRLYAARLPHRGALIPVGCAAWYPVAAGTTRALAGGVIPARAVVPDPAGEERYVWSYALAPGFRKTPAARRLLATLAAELDAAGPAPRVCVTVSDDGARVARRLGMAPVGATREGEAVFG